MNDRVVINYTNHRGQTADRLVIPLGIEFTTAEWHPGRQWILEAFDVGKQATRSFPMSGIHSWRPEEPA